MLHAYDAEWWTVVTSSLLAAECAMRFQTTEELATHIHPLPENA
jgi:hypothetical protein